MKEQKLNSGEPVRCECGKIVAMRRNGKIYIMCKSCKRQIPIVELEPRA